MILPWRPPPPVHDCMSAKELSDAELRASLAAMHKHGSQAKAAATSFWRTASARAILR